MIFVDTGAFLARYIDRDQHHRRARAGWEELRASPFRVLTSNFVLDELFTLLGRRATYAFAAERAERILSSRTLEILRPSHLEELEAVKVFRKFADQKLSFTDAVSFVLMRRNSIRHAFSFDRHFERAGYELWPSPAIDPALAGRVHEI